MQKTLSQGHSLGHSFPRQARLLKPADFKRVFKQSVVSSDRMFRVLARSGEGVSARLGMAVSRKVDSRACGRNRIKRVIRESFRAHHPAAGNLADDGAGVDYVVLANAGAARAANRVLAQSLQKHWAYLSRKLDKAASSVSESKPKSQQTSSA